MKSLYDELSDRLAKEPSQARRKGPRQDIGMLLFAQRDDIAALWKAAEASLLSDAEAGGEVDDGLRAAVERLRPLFGER